MQPDQNVTSTLNPPSYLILSHSSS